jgi:catechol 2,3-dioxygenase-like lactoylglutathione lyase family enzyme
MLDHIGIRVSDIAKAKDFYSKALAPLGYSVQKDLPEYNVFGMGDGGHMADFWVSPIEGDAGVQHVAFSAKDKAMVDAFHKAGLEAGGMDNGAPGYRKEYTPGYYAAFIKDADGHNIEVVFHDPNPSE